MKIEVIHSLDSEVVKFEIIQTYPPKKKSSWNLVG